MITRIQALRYRCFNQLDVQWQRYNVLAGANGSGKSTLLDIPQLFSEMLTRGVTEAFLETSPALGAPRAQSFNELTHRQRGGDFGFVLEAELPDHIVQELVVDPGSGNIKIDPDHWPHTIRYETRFEVFDNVVLLVMDEFLWLIPRNADKLESIQIGGKHPSGWQPIIERSIPRQPISGWQEIIRRSRGKDARIKFELESEAKASIGFTVLGTRPDSESLLLPKFPTDLGFNPATKWFTEMLTQDVLAYAPNLAEMHKACPSALENFRAIRADAVNLPWMVLDLKQKRPEMFTAWVEHVQTALPDIVSIDAVRREDDAHAYLKVEYQGGYSITSAGLSDGTLAILALTILPYLTKPPTLVSLEEPENGVHPRAIEAILESLSSLYNSQVWLATQSPIVLAHTDLESVIIMRSDGNGGREAVSGEQHPRLREWQGSIDLGSLFAAGVLD